MEKTKMKQKRKTTAAAITLFLAATLWGCSARNGTQTVQQEPNQTAQTTPTSTMQQETSPSRQESSGDPAKMKTISKQQSGNDKFNNLEKPQKQAGFATPEEAVKAYLTGFRDNDFERMANTFWDENRADNISRQYAILCGIDIIPEISSNRYLTIKETQDAQKLVKRLEQQIESADFTNMECRGFIPLERLTDIYLSESYQKNLAALAKQNGGSQLDSRMAVIRVNSGSYALLFDIIQYENEWYIFQLGGILSQVLGLEMETAGTLRLDAEDEKIMEKLINNTSEELPQWEKAAARPKTESKGFDTPEQAAIAFLNGLKAKDWEQMLGTFSVESYGEHYDLQT